MKGMIKSLTFPTHHLLINKDAPKIVNITQRFSKNLLSIKHN